MSNLNFVVQMSKDFSISSCFEPIDVVTLHTPWWPQLHSTYHQPQVFCIYFMRFLCAHVSTCYNNVSFVAWKSNFNQDVISTFTIFITVR